MNQSRPGFHARRSLASTSAIHVMFCALPLLAGCGDTRAVDPGDVGVAQAALDQGFGAPEQWSGYFCTATETCAVGDVNGDGKADLVAFTRDPTDAVWVALSTGSGFAAPRRWSNYFCRTGEECRVADMNGDGKADLVAFNHGLNGVNAAFVGLSTGSGFAASQRWSEYFCTASEACAVGDVNGDGKADLVAFTLDPNNDVWVGLSTGNAASAPQQWSDYFCKTGEVCKVADVNGDGKADLVAFNHGLGGANAAWVGLSTGAGFSAPDRWTDYFCTSTETCAVGDVNGDGMADLVAFTRDPDDDVWVGLSSASGFDDPERWSELFCLTGEVCEVADVDGDRAADVIAFNHGLGGANAVWVGRHYSQIGLR